MYILRGPAQTTVPALYSPEDARAVTIGTEQAVSTVLPSQPAEILRSDGLTRFKTGDRLTFRQFLDVIIEAGKVITL